MLNVSCEVCFSSRVYSFPCISAFVDMNEVIVPNTVTPSLQCYLCLNITLCGIWLVLFFSSFFFV